MTLREKIRAWLDDNRAIRQKDVAEAMGLATSSVSMILSGEFPTNNLQAAIGLSRRMRKDYSGATLDWLLDDDQDWPPPEVSKSLDLSPWEMDLIQLLRKWCETPELRDDIADRIFMRGPYATHGKTVVVTAESFAESQRRLKERERAGDRQ